MKLKLVVRLLHCYASHLEVPVSAPFVQIKYKKSLSSPVGVDQRAPRKRGPKKPIVVVEDESESAEAVSA